MWDIKHSILYILFIILAITNHSQSRITKSDLQKKYDYENRKDFTNLVFQPQRNSRKLPPDIPLEELIQRNGYPVEIHEVITEDSYILKMFRIPCGRNFVCNGSSVRNTKPPVIALHPTTGFTASIWVSSLRVENCLPFVLADEGFDVWLPNTRGTYYSNKHLFYDNTTESYWNFSLDELGKYDVPAMMEYVLGKTEKPKLHFITYSGSSWPLFSAMIQSPELNDKIALNIGYAAAMYFERVGALFHIFASSVVDSLQLLLAVRNRTFPEFAIKELLYKVQPIICSPKYDTNGICQLLAFLATGVNSLSQEQLAGVVTRYSLPSLKIIVHMFQIMSTGEFHEYDYGSVGNIRVYGQPNSPQYDLRKVTAPVALIQAPYDNIVTNQSTAKLASILPNVVDYHVIPNNAFSHIEYCCGENANTLVYRHTLKLLHQFS